ncbi:MAG TPA: hypothetical protein VNJ47_00275 [Nevskiales bacterium]|nr:hypothetical protein [Nevskiales bacterium]
MIRQLDLEPFDARDPRLILSWDPETGEISGPGAAFVRGRMEGSPDGFVSCHPVPYYHPLSRDPLRSMTDMAAILGFEYKLPDDLQEHYPQPEEDPEADENTVY